MQGLKQGTAKPLKGTTVQAKNIKLKKKSFLLLMKYQHVADVVAEFYISVTCVKEFRGG